MRLVLIAILAVITTGCAVQDTCPGYKSYDPCIIRGEKWIGQQQPERFAAQKARRRGEDY